MLVMAVVAAWAAAGAAGDAWGAGAPCGGWTGSEKLERLYVATVDAGGGGVTDKGVV